MSEDSRLAAVTKASSDLGGPFSDIDHEQIAERFIAMYDALRLQQGEEVMQHQSRDKSTLEADNAMAPAAPVTAGAEPQPEWPYMVFALGPRVDDLLRDAARYRWLRAEHRISELFVGDGRDAINVDHHVPEVMDALIDAEIAREKDHD